VIYKYKHLLTTQLWLSYNEYCLHTKLTVMTDTQKKCNKTFIQKVFVTSLHFKHFQKFYLITFHFWLIIRRAFNKICHYRFPLFGDLPDDGHVEAETYRRHIVKWQIIRLNVVQCFSPATEPGISLIILSLMRILRRNLKRTTHTFLFISHTTNVFLFKFRCNIFIGVRIIKEMPGSVSSGTSCIC